MQLHACLSTEPSQFSKQINFPDESESPHAAGPFQLRVGPMQKLYRWSAVLQSKQIDKEIISLT